MRSTHIEGPNALSDDPPATKIDIGIAGLRDAVLVGRGGSAAVYAAVETEFDRRVAVKILHGVDESGRQRFATERLGRLSNNPNIVTVHRSGLTDRGEPYLVTEYVSGGSLQDRLEQVGPIPWTEAVGHGLAICTALGEVHNQRPPILHNDIKPANLLLQDGRAMLADFGIAAFQDSSTVPAAGSLHYAPPEMWSEGRDRRDRRSDVYSLAATLFALISGKPPFVVGGPDSEPAQRTRIEQDPAPLLPDDLCPPGLSRWIQRAMSKNPGERQQSVDEFAAGLERAVEAAAPIEAAEGASDGPAIGSIDLG